MITAISDEEAEEALKSVIKDDIEVDKLTGKEVDILLKNYGLPRTGLVAVRRERLLKFVRNNKN